MQYLQGKPLFWQEKPKELTVIIFCCHLQVGDEEVGVGRGQSGNAVFANLPLVNFPICPVQGKANQVIFTELAVVQELLQLSLRIFEVISHARSQRFSVHRRQTSRKEIPEAFGSKMWQHRRDLTIRAKRGSDPPQKHPGAILRQAVVPGLKG